MTYTPASSLDACPCGGHADVQKADFDDWDKSHRVSRRVLKAISKPFEASVAELKENFKAIQSQELSGTPLDLTTVPTKLGWQDSFTNPMAKAFDAALIQVVKSSTKVELGNLGVKIETAKVDSALVEGYAREWVASKALADAVALEESSIAALRIIIDRAVAESWHPTKLAKAIKDSIGLTPRDATALVNLRARLEAQGIAATSIERTIARKAKQYILQRAKTIARTESRAAWNHGTLNAWKMGQSDGEISSTMMKKWIYVPLGQPCPICLDIQAQGPKPLNGAWDGGRAGFVQNPPAHPNCRCTMVLTEL